MQRVAGGARKNKPVSSNLLAASGTGRSLH